MHQSVLMHTNINEGAESRHIAHHTFEHHAGHKVSDLMDDIRKLCRFKFRARIAAGLFEFTQNILNCGNAELLIGEISSL